MNFLNKTMPIWGCQAQPVITGVRFIAFNTYCGSHRFKVVSTMQNIYQWLLKSLLLQPSSWMTSTTFLHASVIKVRGVSQYKISPTLIQVRVQNEHGFLVLIFAAYPDALTVFLQTKFLPISLWISSVFAIYSAFLSISNVFYVTVLKRKPFAVVNRSSAHKVFNEKVSEVIKWAYNFYHRLLKRQLIAFCIP